jgi:hypothetical protein
VQTDGRAAGDVEAAVESATPEDTLVNVSTHSSEQAVLAAVSAFVADRLAGDDVLLVAYNGERWNGGFDMPFLRTRFAQLGLQWPFVDVPYADLMPIVADRFNTTVTGDAATGADEETESVERNDLGHAYAVLCGDGDSDIDPFTDSAEAVEAFRDGRFADLVLHNVADVLRTRALGQLTERFCAKSEYDVKSLTPTREQ